MDRYLAVYKLIQIIYGIDENENRYECENAVY